MRLLVFGGSGRVGRALSSQRIPDVELLRVDRAQADLREPDSCARSVRDARVDAVLNLAAWTAVDAAEHEPATAARVNTEAPGVIAAACAARGLPFVHVSTDQVFDGSGQRAWRPDDATHPLSAYGRTKRDGEDEVRRANGVFAIVRTSWVYSAEGPDFVEAVLRQAAGGMRLRVVDDQVGGPTSAVGVASALMAVAHRLTQAPACSGTYHYAGEPAVSRSDFARAIIRAADLDACVEDVSSSDYPADAARPPNAALDSSLIRAVFGLGREHWRRVLPEVLAARGFPVLRTEVKR